MNYKIIIDEIELDRFISILPELNDNEVYYMSLFGRHKYCPAFPNMRDDSQLARFIARKSEIKEKILRLESPEGSYIREELIVPQESMALYISMNPRNLDKANRELLCTLARRIAEGDTNFSPISLATTEIHRAVDRKFFVDFDFDHISYEEHADKIAAILPDRDSYHILKTRGGLHLLVVLDKVKNTPNKKWHQGLSALTACDVRGSNTLTPVAGCCQGGFMPIIVPR